MEIFQLAILNNKSLATLSHIGFTFQFAAAIQFADCNGKLVNIEFFIEKTNLKIQWFFDFIWNLNWKIVYNNEKA